jgi:hypothetical protein
MTKNLTRSAVLLFTVSITAALVGCTSDPEVTGPTGPTTPVADLTPPAIPAQLTPAPNTTFNHYPRNTTLAWSAVSDPSGPVTYRVEVEYCHGSVYDPSSCTPRTDWCAGALSGTTCSFNFVGMQPGRWRVRAVDNAGNQSAYSDWSSFAFSI